MKDLLNFSTVYIFILWLGTLFYVDRFIDGYSTVII